MKILLTIILLLNFGVSNSQNFIDGIINCSQKLANNNLKNTIGKQIFENNFKLDKSKTIIEIYNETENKLERITLKEYRTTEFPATQIWLNYEVKDDGLLLTELLFPFNLNCTTPWELNDTKEIVEPYLKVLQNKTKIDLKKAILIAKKSGLKKITEWDIDYEKRNLVWTLKDKENNVLKINAKNGKIISEIKEIQIE